MRRHYALLLSRGWVPVGSAPSFNRPQQWQHARYGQQQFMTDQAVRAEGGRP